MTNYQKSEYVEKNDLVCFGVSEHETEEWLPTWSEKANHDIGVLKSWFDKDTLDMDSLFKRPAGRSDWYH